jgi:manganese efflux pump family protein
VFLKIAAFVLPLGFDTFAVAVLLGLRRMRPLRPAATFTFFEAVMPLVGLLIGRLVGARFETPAVVVGGIVLLGVAIYIFKEALEQEEEAQKLAFTTLRTAAFAGFGISMDELAIGFPMGTSGLPVPETIGAIAAQTFVVTFVGILVGRRLGANLGRRASTFAGIAAAVGFGVLAVYLIAQRFGAAGNLAPGFALLNALPLRGI